MFYIENLGRTIILSLSAMQSIENRQLIRTFVSATELATYLRETANPTDTIRGLGGLSGLEEIPVVCTQSETSIAELDRVLHEQHGYEVHSKDRKLVLYCSDDNILTPTAEFDQLSEFATYILDKLPWHDSITWRNHTMSVCDLGALLITSTPS